MSSRGFCWLRAALAPKAEDTEPDLADLAQRVARLEHRVAGLMEEGR